MNNTEYEYSFEATSLHPFIDYCNKNGYTFIHKHKQERTIYRNKDRTLMGRITINDKNGTITKQLDFKEDKLIEGQILGERKESLPLDYTDDNVVASILNILEFTKDNTLIRTRYVYQKDGVIFELDEYTEPRITCAVGVEGEKEQVDKVYNEVKDLK